MNMYKLLPQHSSKALYGCLALPQHFWRPLGPHNTTASDIKMVMSTCILYLWVYCVYCRILIHPFWSYSSACSSSTSAHIFLLLFSVSCFYCLVAHKESLATLPYHATPNFFGQIPANISSDKNYSSVLLDEMWWKIDINVRQKSSSL